MTRHPIYDPLVEERLINGSKAWVIRQSSVGLVGVIEGLRAGLTIMELHARYPDAEYEDLMEIAIRYGLLAI